MFELFCTQLTFDLILRPRYISRLGIHPNRFYYTCRVVNSMDASFYSVLPSKVKISLFCLNGQPTIRHELGLSSLYCISITSNINCKVN